MIGQDIIRQKLTHGIPPLTHEECCWLYLMAFGEEIAAAQKRCDHCGGTGVVESRFSGEERAFLLDCSVCGGSGKK